MATNTTNYSLIKPDLSDNVDISDINSNMDTIDTTMFANATNITSLQTAVKSIEETAEQSADYTLALGDAGKIVNMNKTGAATLTVPLDSSVAFPIGTIVGVYNQSSDLVTVAGAAGVTVRNTGDVAQYAEASLRKRATNEWVLVGV